MDRTKDDESLNQLCIEGDEDDNNNNDDSYEIEVESEPNTRVHSIFNEANTLEKPKAHTLNK